MVFFAVNFYICSEMKRFLNILVLAIFVNFMALPSIASLMDIEIPSTVVVMSEEENHNSSLSFFEKTIPKLLNVHDFLKFFQTLAFQKMLFITDDNFHLSPLLSIFSPPPEV